MECVIMATIYLPGSNTPIRLEGSEPIPRLKYQAALELTLARLRGYGPGRGLAGVIRKHCAFSLSLSRVALHRPANVASLIPYKATLKRSYGEKEAQKKRGPSPATDQGPHSAASTTP